jgi:mRNA interferase MazF
MATFDAGAVVKVPFPYTDMVAQQVRPALVVSDARYHTAHGLLWVVMITSAENRGWREDVAIGDLRLAGLPAPSVIRAAKIATIDAARARVLGSVSERVLARVQARIRRVLGL